MQTKYSFKILKFLFCFILFNSTFFLVKAQQTAINYVDSIKKVLPRLKNTERIDALNHLGRTYQALNSDTSRWYSRQALAEAEKSTI